MSPNSDSNQWYPSTQVVKALEEELSRLYGTVNDRLTDGPIDLASISAQLLKWFGLPGFPNYYTQRWLWLASLLRRSSDAELQRIVGAALLYCGNAVTPTSLNDNDVQKLRWVIDSSCSKAVAVLKVNHHSLLSHEEVGRIQSEILRLLDASQGAIDPHAVSTRTELLKRMCGKWCFPSIVAKLERLVQVANGSTDERARFAKAALSYFVAEDDVVPDKIGILGLVDDVYVIEWAYAFVTGATSRLPLLGTASNEWPFLDKIVFRDHDGPLILDRYFSYVVGLVLLSLFETNQNNVVVVRESGPVALVAAVFAAVALHKKQDSGQDSDRGLSENIHVFIGDDSTHHRAVYLRQETIQGRVVHWIKVGKEGRIIVDDSALEFVWPAANPHVKSLSTGNDISEWLQSRHPSALTFITSSLRRLTSKTPGVLLVTQRRRLEEVYREVNPFGLPIASLVDIRYVASTGAESMFTSSATSAPPIYAASDDDVAIELLKSPPAHISDWVVIVDGGQRAVQFHAAMQSSPETAGVRVCVVAELHEREHCRTLCRAGVHPWFADFSDVEISEAVDSENLKSTGILRRFMTRSLVHIKATTHYTQIDNAGFEMLDDAVQVLSKSEQADAGGPLERLAIQVTRFCKKATGYPLGFDEALKDELFRLASGIRSEARRLQLFSSEAKSTYEIFDLLIAENQLYPDRTDAICAIASGCPPSHEVAVVVATAVVASACRAATSSDPRLSRVRWVSLDDVRQSPPFDRLIVATWLGRSAMREISHGGFAGRIDFALFNFERRWLESTLHADSLWLRDLASETDRRQLSVTARLGQENSRPSVWTSWKTERPSKHEVDESYADDEIVSALDTLESRVTDAIRNTILPASRDAVRARLVLFEQTGAYAYLPPGGRVIALSAVADAGQTSSQKAEDLLFRKIETLRPGMVVAFGSGSDRDLIDARSDSFLKDSARVRKSADLWRQAVRGYLKHGHTCEQLSALLAEAGHGREPSTIQAWAFGNSIVAPMKYAALVPLLAELTKDPLLKLSIKSTIRSIDLLYRAREQAADAIVKEVFAGSIDLDAETLVFEVDGREIAYELHRIRSIEKITMVSADIIGRVLKYQGKRTEVNQGDVLH